jgi:hypothetical protein
MNPARELIGDEWMLQIAIAAAIGCAAVRLSNRARPVDLDA